MGYSNSLRTIDKVKDYLETLLYTNSDTSWTVNEPRKLAFSLREALHTAKVRNVIRYKELDYKYSFRVRGDKVIAKYIRLDFQKPKSVENSIVKAFNSKSLNDVVVELSRSENKSVTEFRFPDFVFDSDELVKIVKLCAKLDFLLEIEPDAIGAVIKRQ